MKKLYVFLLGTVALTSYGSQGPSCHTKENVTPEKKETNQPQKDCDGGTSKCGTCQTPYANPFMPCNTLFDEHMMQGLHSSKDVMDCYARVFEILSQVAPYTTGSPIVCPSKTKAAVANYTRVHEEELQK